MLCFTLRYGSTRAASTVRYDTLQFLALHYVTRGWKPARNLRMSVVVSRRAVDQYNSCAS